MDSKQHLLLGALTGIIVYGASKFLNKEKPDIKGAVGSMVAGGITALLPDIIEPPTNPNHRGLFHSVTLLALLIGGNFGILRDDQLPRDVKEVIALLSSSYGSHLLSDASTPRGLPLI